MTNEQLEKILLEFKAKTKLKHKVEIKNVQWSVDQCDSNSALFYYRNNNSKSNELFSDRIKSTSFSVLFTNIDDERSFSFENVIVVGEEDWLPLQKRLMDYFYPQKNKNLKIVGITGTNGKTTTVDLLLQLSQFAGKKAISAGTLGLRSLQGTIRDFGMTSPPYIEIRKIIYEFNEMDAIFFEVSSHALAQERFFQIKFDIAGWTSFSRDHLDYHKTEDEYFSQKLKIKDYLKDSRKFFVPWREKILFDKISQHTEIQKTPEFNSDNWPLFFRSNFNKSNLELAKIIVEELWKTPLNISIEKLAPPPGRFKVIESRGKISIVDFAHTPDAISNICEAVKEAFPMKKLWIVFGCGGDRDRGKRPLMGSVAEKYGAKIFVTSDNPRTEDPLQIMADVKVGIKEKDKIVEEVDRKKCLHQAIKLQTENEILVVVGKGHENYIDINGVKLPYSDEDEIKINYGIV